MATIRDIAKLSGYSVSTVSRVLNHHPYVTEEKREKILAIIEELEYIPNAKARHLSTGASKNIGVMVPYTNHSYFDKLTGGILKAAFNSGYKVTLLPTNYCLDKEKEFLDELASKALDGMIITSKKSSFELISNYQKYAPIVCCEETKSYSIPYVMIDRKKSYLELFKRLKSLGYQRIGLTTGRNEKESATTAILFQSYKEVFGSLRSAVIFRNCTTFEDGVRAGLYFSELDNIDVIFANSDEIAAGILDCKKNNTIKIIGEENLLASRLLNFSTIDHHLDQCGEEAFNLLLNQEKKSVTIPYTFIERDFSSKK